MADQSEFEKLNIQILAISANNPFSQKVYAKFLNLPYPLLSDFPNLKVIQHYDMLKRVGEAQQPMARGAYFLIDKKGTVQGKWINTPGEVFPNDQILKAASENLN